MAMSECVECHRPVSSEAPSCPHCGKPSPTAAAGGARVAPSVAAAVGAPTKPCKRCKALLPLNAKQCPSCNIFNPTPSGVQASTVVGIVLGSLLVLGLLVRAVGGPPTRTAEVGGAERRIVAVESPPPESVDAVDLWNQYEANEVAADNAFKGHRLLVLGRVQSIDKDFTNDIVIVLRSPNQFMGTHATMVRGAAAKAATLSMGQTVTLNCECRGRVVGSPVLTDCRF